MTAKVVRFLAGFYRVTIEGGRAYGNVKKNKETRMWEGEIRSELSSQILRYAGIWNTKREAVEEVVWILEREYVR
jgi:hypothetical protein